jgi:hypothetical protein
MPAPFPRRVNVCKTRLHPVAISQHCDSVAIGDARHRGMDQKVPAGTEPVPPPIVTQPGCCLPARGGKARQPDRP